MWHIVHGKNYEDDTTPYIANLTYESVISELEEPSFILLKWFNNYFVKVNSDKNHVLK